MTEVALALIAWLLGLLTPQFVEQIARRYRRPELMRSMSLELDEQRFTLLTIRFNLRVRLRQVDREFIAWAALRARNYHGINSDTPARQRFIELEGYDDQRLAALNAPRDDRRSTWFQKVSLPFTSSQVSAWAILSPEVQRRLIEILSRIEMFNATVDRLHTNFLQSFEPQITAENWQALRDNEQIGWSLLDGLAQQAVEQIDLLMPMLGSP